LTICYISLGDGVVLTVMGEVCREKHGVEKRERKHDILAVMQAVSPSQNNLMTTRHFVNPVPDISTFNPVLLL